MTQRDQFYLVTGGRSGLGRACAAALATRGERVVIADMTPPAAEDREAQSDCCEFIVTDVLSEVDVQQAIERGQERFGALRGVIQCAGILGAERLVDRAGPASLEAFRRVIEVNLVGTFNVARLTADVMSRNDPDADGERGVIVMTSSVAAEEGQIGQAAYAASKGGVASLTLPLARELGAHGIRVVSIAPGAFETPMLAQAAEKLRRSLAEQTPFPRRLGRPDEFASLVLQVIDNRMLNGCVLRLDGGLRMGPR